VWSQPFCRYDLHRILDHIDAPKHAFIRVSERSVIREVEAHARERRLILPEPRRDRRGTRGLSTPTGHHVRDRLPVWIRIGSAHNVLRCRCIKNPRFRGSLAAWTFGSWSMGGPNINLTSRRGKCH